MFLTKQVAYFYKVTRRSNFFVRAQGFAWQGEALDAALAGMEGGMPETFEQLDELLVTLGASVGGS